MVFFEKTLDMNFLRNTALVFIKAKFKKWNTGKDNNDQVTVSCVFFFYKVANAFHACYSEHASVEHLFSNFSSMR